MPIDRTGLHNDDAIYLTLKREASYAQRKNQSSEAENEELKLCRDNRSDERLKIPFVALLMLAEGIADTAAGP